MIVLATVADAIVTELATLSASGAYSTAGGSTFTPTRAYLHELAMTASPAFKASVAPGSKTTEDAARGVARTEFELPMTFSKRVTAVTNAILDPLMKSVELVQDFFDDGHALAGLTNVRSIGCRFDGGGVGEVFDEGRLDTENFFWSQLTIIIHGWD